MSRRKGFTLIELLVVVAIIALLVSILMPALGRARELAKQVQCASQLKGIGSAIALYQNDYKDLNPSVGKGVGNGMNYAHFGPGIYKEAGDYTNRKVFNPDWNWENGPSVGGAMYLLVKYEDLVPKMFLCPSADDVEMDFQEVLQAYDSEGYDQDRRPESWADLNDFNSVDNFSYSYNDPYNRLLDASASSSLAVMADKSPKWDAPGTSADPYNEDSAEYPYTSPDGSMNDKVGTPQFQPDWTDDDGNNPRHGNSKNHQTEVQNVLYADSHVKKDREPTVGLSNDNIYTFWEPDTDTPVTEKAMIIGSWDTDSPQTMYDTRARIEDSYLGN